MVVYRCGRCSLYVYCGFTTQILLYFGFRIIIVCFQTWPLLPICLLSIYYINYSLFLFQGYLWLFTDVAVARHMFIVGLQHKCFHYFGFRIIMGCLQMWPLLVICLLWAIVAGFFMWLFETRHNPEQFPRPFMSGLFEGFWWSFISMTTVGYGLIIIYRFLSENIL